MALYRLTGAVDSLLRVLPPPMVARIAGRVADGTATAAEAAVLGALDGADLEAVGASAPAFVGALAYPLAYPMADSAPQGAEPTVELLSRAAVVVRAATATLAARLPVLPGDEWLECVGDLIEAGKHTAADLVVLRALPGPHLCTHSIGRHFATFTDYRLLDN
jgi:hypothetical protein